MADFSYQGTFDGVERSERDFNVANGTTASIAIGDIVTMADGFAAKTGNGEANATGFYGLAVEASNETTGAAGTVKVVYHTSGLILRGIPSTPGNLDPAILFDRVSLDLDGSTQKVDENDPNAAYSLFIWDYNTTNGTIDVVLLSNY